MRLSVLKKSWELHFETKLSLAMHGIKFQIGFRYRPQTASALGRFLFLALSPLLSMAVESLGRRLNGFLGLSLNDMTILFLVILLVRTVSVSEGSLCITTLAFPLA